MSQKKTEPESQDEQPQFTFSDRRHWALEEDRGDADIDASERLPSYVEQLKKEAEEKDQKLREYIEAYKSKNAEIDEFRQRLQKENEGRLELIKTQFFGKLIPILDNLKRAHQASQAGGDIESFQQGIDMIASQFQRELDEQGVETITAAGRKFDPKTDEAVMTVDTEDPQNDGMIVEELEPGYRFKEHLIQPAKVKVAKLKS